MTLTAYSMGSQKINPADVYYSILRSDQNLPSHSTGEEWGLIWQMSQGSKQERFTTSIQPAMACEDGTFSAQASVQMAQIWSEMGFIGL